LVGANTAKNDDPALTVRFSKTNGSNIKQPIRIVLSSNGQLPSTLKLFRKDMPAKTIVVIADTCDDTFKQSISEMNVEVLKLPRNNEGQIDLNNLLDKLGELGITSLLVEGGMTVHESFFSEQLVNKVCVYIAPVIIGTLPKKQWLSEPDVSQIAHDILFTGTTAASEETLHV
jgi:diaminohydroxyphosphoribosylaminopyrimidine deaminase/5-amino-6-(5-phosphoribosylamino)uracil reductase